MNNKPLKETFLAWKEWSKSQVCLDTSQLTFKYQDIYIDFSANIITFHKNVDRKFLWHRLDGPALIDKHGMIGFWIDDKQYNEEDYWNHPLVKEKLFVRCLVEVLNE